MNFTKMREDIRLLSISSIVCGVLGGAFYWWVPFGMVLGLVGLLFGFVDWTISRRRLLDHRLSLIGMLISAAALTLDVAIALLGLQSMTFGGP